MLGLKTLLVSALAAVSVTGLAVDTTGKSSPAAVAARQSCVYTCGSVCYWQEDIDGAVNQGYGYYSNGQQVGSGDYPHTYNNYEGFSFPGSGPYQEFPILSSYQPYTGGSPGADRVVFNGNGEFQGAITHTGASGNNFVACN